MATEINVLSLSKAIAATMADAQYYAVALNSSDQWAICTAQGQRATGIMQEEPATGNASAMVFGVSKAVIGASVDEGDPLTVDSSSRVIPANDRDEYVLGYALSAASTAGEIITMLVTHSGSISEISGSSQQTYVAAANYATTGQYLAVKAHSTDGQAIKCSVAGEAILGVLQNAPASGAECEIATYGECTAEAGSTITAGEQLAIDANANFIPATGTAQVVGWAIADIATGETGTIFLAPLGMYSVDGAALASTKVWVGNGSGVAAAVVLSSDVTMANTGAVTIANDVVSAAKMASTVAGSDGCIFKSTSTANAVAELDVPLGNVVVGTSGDVGLLDMGASAGNIMVDSGTAPASVAVSGEATLAANGALTIANDVVTAAKMGSTSAGVIFKGAAANAVTELQLTVGLIPVGTTADVTTIDMGAAAGNIMVDSGTAPASVAVSGAATLAADGTLTLANDYVTAAMMSSTAGGGAGIIFKGTNTANAIAELDVAAGSIVIGTTNDVDDLVIGLGGQKLTVNAGGTAPVWDNNKIKVAALSGLSAADDPTGYEADFTVATGTAETMHKMILPCGLQLGYWPLGAGQTITIPVGMAGGIDIGGDQADDEGFEIFGNAYCAEGSPFSVGFDAAFYFLAQLTLQAADGCDDLFVGFRQVELVQTNMTDYDTYFGLGADTAASPMLLKVREELGGAAAASTTTTQTIASTVALQIKVLVSATGVATVLHDAATPGTLAAPTATSAFTFDDGDQVMPIVRILNANATQTGTYKLSKWEVGLQ